MTNDNNFLYKVFGFHIPPNVGTGWGGPIGGQPVVAKYVLKKGEDQKALDLAREDEVDIVHMIKWQTNLPLTLR